ncbi:MAG: chemotaxis protein CheA [Capsulimonas sp.]|uniref:chemotaxis protein CheA n=1 Tax=Capsulimonas sp. TaxID=2494211 RepID=UPI00326380B7
MTMFHQAFFEEAGDLLADLEGLLLRLEEAPDDLELLNTIFRCAHSIKGGSATFGFTDIAHFTHGLETLLDKVRNGEIKIDRSLSQILFESLDQMKALLAVARGESTSAPDSTALSARIEAAILGQPAMVASSPTLSKPKSAEEEGWGVWTVAHTYHLYFAPGIDILRQGGDPLLLIGQLGKVSDILSVSCDDSRLPTIAEMDPEACYLSWDIDLRSDKTSEEILEIFEFVADESEIRLEITGEIRTPVQSDLSVVEIPAAAPEPATPIAEIMETAAPAAAIVPSAMPPIESAKAAPSAETQTLRVSTDKVDKLINLVGELVINQSMLNEVVQDFSMAKLPRLIEAVAEMERASRELQERVMAVRMLPIKHAFGRFPRLVRDLAATVGKKIELKTSGEDTELDKGMIESIADPLTHLVRNSIDHGLETPEERRAAGKPETGTVSLHALHEGGSIAVEVSDDGRGLSRERILKKAIERGWVTENDTPSDETLYNFIFMPGFSTAAAVTDLSGRGVGMDIVKQGVQALGGSITLTSTPGVGTTFRIRLPLTMAILEGLSLTVGNETYILPLTSIVESIQPAAGDVRKIAGRAEIAMVRGEVLPVVRLYEIFGSVPKVTDPTQGLLVIVENDNHKVAVLVDELIGQSQVVIKSLETNYRKVRGIAGATIMGDGRVALILDVPGLVRDTLSGNAALAAAA